MIFMVRQLAEKAIEHNSKQYFVFVDLCKAYDSVPRAALWVTLEKLGVPKEMVDLVKSFHDDTKGELLEEIEVIDKDAQWLLLCLTSMLVLLLNSG